MNCIEAAELLPIIKAFSEGKPIQYRIKDNESAIWNDVDKNYHKFSPHSFMYRIKPNSVYRSFKDAEECWQEMQNHQPFGWIKRDGYRYNIISISDTNVKVIDTRGAISTLYFSYLFLRKDYHFIDGTLFGVRVEE